MEFALDQEERNLLVVGDIFEELLGEYSLLAILFIIEQRAAQLDRQRVPLDLTFYAGPLERSFVRARVPQLRALSLFCGLAIKSCR